MATGITRIGMRPWAKALVLLWLAQLAQGEPSAACKTMPALAKDDSNSARCCEIPEMFSNETLNQCMEEVDRSSKPQVEKSCEFANCVLKKQKHIKSDGSFDVDQIRSYIKDTVKASAEWKTLIEKVVLDECIPMAEKDSPGIAKQLKTAMGECNPVPALAFACSAAKFYAKCPSKDWTGSKPCDEWKKYLSECSHSVEDLNEMYVQIESQKLA
uniref:OBP47-like domain-containing protein n=1 Tax=Anopheles dirus TaxID=7168 RepID=A0A182NKP1_9DIPT